MPVSFHLTGVGLFGFGIPTAGWDACLQDDIHRHWVDVTGVGDGVSDALL